MSWNLGLLLITVVALIWTGSSVLLQYIFSDLEFASPFVVTFVETILFTLYIPLYFIFLRCAVIRGNFPFYPQAIQASDENIPLKQEAQDNARQNVATVYSHKLILLVALTLVPIRFLANWMYNYSLLTTSASSSTIISSLSGVFTLIFSTLAGIDNMTLWNISGLMLGLLGVCLICVQDYNPGGQGSIWGDLAALTSTIGYGLYVTMIKALIPDNDSFCLLVYGYLGIISAVLFTPILILMVNKRIRLNIIYP